MRVRLELNQLNIDRPKKRWDIYFVVVAEHPTDTEKMVLATLPIDPIKMGLDHVAFVEVRLSDTREKALQVFNKAVQTIPEIEQCHMIASNFDYLMKVRTRNIQEYRRIMGETLSSLPFVASTSTFVAMEAVKEVF